MTRHGADVDRTDEWAALRERYLRASGERPPARQQRTATVNTAHPRRDR